MIFYPNLANHFSGTPTVWWKASQIQQKLKLSHFLKIGETVILWTCFTNNHVNVRIGIVGKGLYPTFALLNHRYIKPIWFCLFRLLFVTEGHNAQLLFIVHDRNNHDPQPQLQQQPFQVLPWRCNGCSSMQEYQGRRRGLPIKKDLWKPIIDM